MIDATIPKITQAAKFATVYFVHDWLTVMLSDVCCLSEYPVVLSFSDGSLVIYDNNGTNPVCYIQSILK